MVPSAIADSPSLLLEIGVSKNDDIPKSSILIGFAIINHPFWGTPIFRSNKLGPSIKGLYLFAPKMRLHPGKLTTGT